MSFSCRPRTRKCGCKKRCVKTVTSTYKLYENCCYNWMKVCPCCCYEYNPQVYDGCPFCGSQDPVDPPRFGGRFGGGFGGRFGGGFRRPFGRFGGFGFRRPFGFFPFGFSPFGFDEEEEEEEEF